MVSDQLDMKIHSFMQTEESFGYVRYADDMIFAIKSGVDSEGSYHRFRQFFQKALEDLKLAETSFELIRGRPRTARLGRLNRIDWDPGDKGTSQTLEEEVHSRTHNGENG